MTGFTAICPRGQLSLHATCTLRHVLAFPFRRSPQRVMATTASADWSAQDTRKMLHAVYRVGDLEATEEYYTKHFGMKRLRYRDIPDVRLLSFARRM